MTDKQIAKCFTAIRKSLALTHEKLAEIVDVETRTVERWQNEDAGKSDISALHLANLHRYLRTVEFQPECGVEVSELLLAIFQDYMSVDEWLGLWARVKPPLLSPRSITQQAGHDGEVSRRLEQESRSRLSYVASVSERYSDESRLNSFASSATYREYFAGPDPLVFSDPDNQPDPDGRPSPKPKAEIFVLGDGNFRVRIPEGWKSQISPIKPPEQIASGSVPSAQNLKTLVGPVIQVRDNFGVVAVEGRAIFKGDRLLIRGDSGAPEAAQVLQTRSSRSKEKFGLVSCQGGVRAGDAAHFVERSKLSSEPIPESIAEMFSAVVKTRGNRTEGVSAI